MLAGQVSNLRWVVPHCRFLVEKGIEEVDAVVILMRGRGFHRSIDDIRIAAESSYRRFLQAARSLQVSCPRWWSALDLGAPAEVAKGCMIRRAEMEEVAEDEEAEVLDHLREVDKLDALFVPKEVSQLSPALNNLLSKPVAENRASIDGLGIDGHAICRAVEGSGDGVDQVCYRTSSESHQQAAELCL
jgi:hypothetical protein